MNTDIKSLSERLARVESEVASIRQEVIRLDRSEAGQQEYGQKGLAQFQVDKELIRSIVGELFTKLSIGCQPIDTEELQKQMEQAGLETNELSRDLIRAREE